MLKELKRRRVVRVICAYAVFGFIAMQVANEFFPALHLPAWLNTLVAVLIVLGFPLVFALAWIFDITPAGVRRTDRAHSPGAAVAVAAAPRWLVLAALLPLTGAVGWYAWQRLARAPAADRAVVAILPFHFSGNTEFQYLSTGIVDLLMRNLDGVGNLRTVDPGSSLKPGEDRSATPSAGRVIALRLGAGHFVVGSIHEAAGRLRIHAALYAANGDDRPLAQSRTVEGPLDRIFELADQVSSDLIAAHGFGATSARLARSAALTTASLPALAAYVEAEQAFRRADMAVAIEGFQRAVAEDSTFALAHYRLGTVYWWADAAITGPNRHQLSRASAETAYRFRERLGTRDRRLVEAFVALHRGDIDDAESQYLALLADYPDDVEARFQYADLLHHWNAPRGRPMAEALAPFAAVLEADPDFACPI